MNRWRKNGLKGVHKRDADAGKASVALSISHTFLSAYASPTDAGLPPHTPPGASREATRLPGPHVSALIAEAGGAVLVGGEGPIDQLRLLTLILWISLCLHKEFPLIDLLSAAVHKL